MRVEIGKNQSGFTLVELLIAMGLSVVVLAIIFSTFKSQHDSYIVQSQVSMTQQNLRAALYMVTRDIQMAGHYNKFANSEYLSDWDDNTATADIAIRPLVYLINDASGVSDVKDGTDILVIIKASDKHRELVFGESADSSSAALYLDSTLDGRDLDGDGDDDLNYWSAANHTKYGLLVKKDLSRAEVFEVDSSNNFVFNSGLIEDYGEGDSIYRLDVIMYRIDNSDPDHPSLRRKNLGTENHFNVIAEDVDNLQFEFILNDGSIVNNLDTKSNIPLVRSVKVYILARSENKIKGYTDSNSYEMGSVIYHPDDKYMRRLLSATVKTRNIGM